MKESEEPTPPAGTGDESLVRRCVAARLRFWGLAAGLPLLLVLANLTLLLVWQIRETHELRRELEALRADAVRLGQPLEIYNAAWGTVLDAVDPTRFPSRDARDPRFGALVQQYVPKGNPAQSWSLRAPSAEAAPPAPLSLEAHLRHASSFLGARDPVRAAQAFEYCLQHYPDAAAAHNGLAIALRDRGDFVRSVPSHDRAIELDPNRPQFVWERAVTQLRRGDADAAIKDCEKVLAGNPELADAWNTLGLALRQQGKLAQALKHHDKALELSPDREDFWRDRAATHQANGDAARSAADSARAREIRERPR